ncbi:MAG: SBBP repeat-containing protein [Bryobacteraceae bacterium]|nr:SBBP repeat-containing protein [Bryobacteraceae bacterium]
MKIGQGMREFRNAGLLLAALSMVNLAPAASVRRLLKGGDEAKAVDQYGKLPLSFEENRGQTDQSVRYLSRGNGYTLFLTDKDAVLSLTRVEGETKFLTTDIRMRFAGSTGKAGLEASELQSGKSNYMSGSNPKLWQTGIRRFGRINYKNLYPGVDAVFYGNQRQLEYDFVVAPGVDPKQIRLEFEGTSGVAVSNAGNLVLKTALGDLEQLRPVAYQNVNGTRRQIDARYAVSNGKVGFELARYDRRKPLIIDPVLQWTNFLGGTGVDTATAIAVDTAGNSYVVGSTSSVDFPASSRFLGVARGGAADGYIIKYNTTGTTAAYATFINGNGNDQPLGVTVDATGNAFVVGSTDSTNFPLVTPVQNIYNGNQDGFALKINPGGDILVYSTYIGGLNSDTASDVKVDADGRAVIVGTTSSFNVFQGSVYNGGSSDAFMAKLAATGNIYVYGFYLGSTGTDSASGVAVDSTGAAYVTGRTNSGSFPRTPGVLQGALSSTGVFDAFVAKVTPLGFAVYSTFLGGAGIDAGVSIAVDSTFNAYVLGFTESAVFPGATTSTNAGAGDLFLTKINPNATAIVYSRFIGGAGIELAGRLAVNPTTGIAYLTGTTQSTDFPNLNSIQVFRSGLTDAVVVEVSPAGALASSTFLGGLGDETGNGIAIDGSNNIYLAGTTSSFDFPKAPLQAGGGQLLGTQDGYLVKLSNCSVGLAPLVGGAPGRDHTALEEIGSVTVTADATCTYAAQVSDATWIFITSPTTLTGSGTVTYRVSANTGPPRTGFINIGGQRFTLTQTGGQIPGGGCLFPPSIQGDQVPAQGVARSFVVGTQNSACPYTITTSAPWIQLFPNNGTNTATINYTVFPNFGSALRAASIFVSFLQPGQPGHVTYQILITQPGTGLSEAQRFVTLVYFNFLGRYPTPSEIDFQVAALTAGALRGDLALNFFNAEEFNRGGRFVAGLYVGLLNRNAEFAGWLFQRNALATNAVSQNQLVTNFLNSVEYMAANPAQTDAQFVNLLYVQVLGRVPTIGEVNLQVGALAAGTTRVALASAFLNTAEFRLRTTGRLTSFLLYAALLGRNGSSAELLNRQFQLDSGTPLRNIIIDFVGSGEFANQLL